MIKVKNFTRDLHKQVNIKRYIDTTKAEHSWTKSHLEYLHAIFWCVTDNVITEKIKTVPKLAMPKQRKPTCASLAYPAADPFSSEVLTTCSNQVTTTCN